MLTGTAKSSKYTAALLLSITILVLNWFSPVQAGLYKCIDAEGKTEYQDKPCKISEKKLEIKTRKKTATGFHFSWFSNPVIGTPTVKCSSTTCTCGVNEFKFIKDKQERVMASLQYLPVNWQNYDGLYKEYLGRKMRIGADKDTLKKYACLITWRKKVIRTLYPEVSKHITEKLQNLQSHYAESQCGPNFILTLRMQNGLTKAPCMWAGSSQQVDMKRKIERAKHTFDQMAEYVAILKKPKPRVR